MKESKANKQYMSRSEAEAVIAGLTEKEKIALLCLLRRFEKQHGTGDTATSEDAQPVPLQDGE